MYIFENPPYFNHYLVETLGIIKRHAEKFETQQKILEYAVECLEGISKQRPALTDEEKLWMRFKWAKSLVVVEKTALILLGLNC